MTTSPKPSISLSTPSTPITQRRTVTYDSTRIPKPPSNTRLQRSSSMHMRTIGSSSPVTKCAAELNDGKTINSSNVYSLTGTTEFNCKNSKRSPNGTSHTPDIEKGFASRTIGNHCASSTRHGMVNRTIIYSLLTLNWLLFFVIALLILTYIGNLAIRNKSLYC